MKKLDRLTEYEIHLIIELIENKIGILDSTLCAFKGSDLSELINPIQNIELKKNEYVKIIKKLKEEV